MRETIAAYWRQQTGQDLPSGCALVIDQITGGQVVGAYVQHCDLPKSEQLRLEAAALKAQPLPYAGYESVFVTSLTLGL